MTASRHYLKLARLLLTAVASTPFVSCSEHSPTQPGVGGASFAIVILSPNPQTGQVGSTLPPLRVQARDAKGHVLYGEVVNFVVTGGGGSVFAPTVVTDVNTGVAQEVWTLGPVAGPQSVEARLIDPGTGNPLSVATFTANATAAPATLISAQAGNGQTATVGSAVPISPAVLVTDRFANPIAGVTVTFAVTGGGGSVVNPSQATGANGIASAGPWTLGTLAGPNTLTVTKVGLTGSPVTFTATAVGPGGLNIADYRGDGQTQGPGSTLSIRPAAQVTDLSGHPAPGVQVTFTVTAGGGSIIGASQVTDANGIATVGNWTLGAATGLNELQAAFNTGTSRGYTVFVASGRCDDVATVNVNEFNLALSSGQLPSNGVNAGRGFFEGTQVIFTGGPIYGTDADHLVIGADVRGVFQDVATTPVCVVGTTPVHHTFAQLALVAGASGPPGLVTTQESFAASTSPDNGYVLLRYVFHNAGAASISNFFAGFVTDWDLLFDGTASSDAVTFNSSLGVGEVTESAMATYPQVLGLVPIGAAGNISFRGWAGATGNGDDIVSTRAGYFSLLSGGINTTAATGDVRELMGLGPLTIQPGQSVVIYIAIVGGENESAFSNNVAAARRMAATLGFAAP